MRLIDADALEEEFIHRHPVGDGGLIAKAPTIEERPKGKWIFDSIGCYCSECKKHPDVTTDYCPFCGADMRGEA